jgi:dihydroorotate dehydrogenase
MSALRILLAYGVSLKLSRRSYSITVCARDLQARGILEELISAAKRERDNLPGRKPRLVLKIAPDVRQDQLEDIAAAVRSVGVDGVIVSNTTVQRPASLKSGTSTQFSPCAVY